MQVLLRLLERGVNPLAQMLPLELENSSDLLRFLHRKKTELSCMENPHTFLMQLRDHNLIPERRYEKLSRMRSRENLRRGVYEVLDWLEAERSQYIVLFWRCVFEDTIISRYPTLRLLRNSVMDGSFREFDQLSEEVRSQTKRKEFSDEEDEEEQQQNVRKKVKTGEQRRLRRRVDEDEEQPGPSSQATPGPRKRSKKITFSSPVKKGEQSDVWSWPLCRSQLPVICGGLKGSLSKKRLAEGQKCVYFHKRWLTPGEFEKRGGKQSSRSWKQSIRCQGVALGTLIQRGLLKSPRFRRGFSKARRSLFPPDGESTDEDEDGEASSHDAESPAVDTDEEQQHRDRKLFTVSCGASTGTLHKPRFISGNLGKSIRTETRWMTPEEFAKEASSSRDASWKKDIKWEQKPLGVLMKEEILRIHSLLCDCQLCCQDPEDLEEIQRNDDQCWVCRREDESQLVQCDRCPRSFHQTCHLPRVEDGVMGDASAWICTFCQFTPFSDELGMEAALSQLVSRHVLRCQYLLLQLSSSHDDQTSAATWFRDVADRLQGRGFQTVRELVSDVQLVLSRQAQTDPDEAELITRLKEMFHREFRNVFNVPEETDGS